MNLYRHYKNKPYKFIGTARHSESQEELVIYETLYDSPGGKIWVRPKEMFFETVNLEEKTVPRFEKIALELHHCTSVGEAEVQSIAPISANCFESFDLDRLRGKIKAQAKNHLITASISGHIVGFKYGFEFDADTYESWFGGVHHDFRNLGIANDLMMAQHQWCRGQGYRKVRTTTQNRFKQMLLLNLKSGFQITGTQLKDNGDLLISLELTL